MPARAALAFAAGEAVLLAGTRTASVPCTPQLDQLSEEEWHDLLSSLLKGTGQKKARATAALPALTAPLKTTHEPPEDKNWAASAARELVQDAEPAYAHGAAKGGPWWVCAASKETVRRLLSAGERAGLRIDAVEPAALSLLRLPEARRAFCLVAALSSTGAEIAAGTTDAPFLARTVAARKVEDLAGEVELTVRYLTREGKAPQRVVLAGPAAGRVAELVRASGIEADSVLETAHAAEAVARGAASRKAPRSSDLASALRGPAPWAPQAAAAACAALLLASAAHAMGERARADALRQEAAGLRAQRDVLQAQLARLEGPRQQQARAALAELRRRAARTEVLDHLPQIVPEDLWVDRVHISGTAVKLDGQALSRDSVLKLAAAAASAWQSVVIKAVDRAETPAASYKFQIEATLQP
jgi:Tfp pilus assembly protein PilN